MNKRLMFTLGIVGLFIIVGAAFAFSRVNADASAKAPAQAEGAAAKAEPVAEPTEAPEVIAPTEPPAMPEAPAIAQATEAPVVEPTPVPDRTGQDVLKDWKVAGVSVLSGGNVDTAEHRAIMGGEGENMVPVTYVQYFHADPGTLKVIDPNGKVVFERKFDKAWLAAVVMPPGYTYEVIDVAWNENQGHYNIWPVEFYLQTDMITPLTLAYNVIWRYQGTTGESDRDATARAYAAEYWGINAGPDFPGEDHAPYAVLVDAATGNFVDVPAK